VAAVSYKAKYNEDAFGTEVRVKDEATGGEKGQKLERYDLLPWDALDEVARVFGLGARKYADRNWEKGYNWGLSLGALVRHVARWASGETFDHETGCHHLAHAAFHCLALVTFENRGLGTNDVYLDVAKQGIADKCYQCKGGSDCCLRESDKKVVRAVRVGYEDDGEQSWVVVGERVPLMGEFYLDGGEVLFCQNAHSDPQTIVEALA
jgi:hypothetical protein